ncbi:hypothetical protein GALMADRAFT_142611 [Galerina marginata CBS 339.88]|uniref:Uncharacterized protein n=1 Tax=Galerina marginata (strain CBS 339.88) TaxID=685588 RepID=A0A067SYY3_GALM3|nr:hypothetical protein GALMADRAFT_142611 [Galerina marginata CBS 339.88]
MHNPSAGARPAELHLHPQITGNDIPDEIWRIIAGYTLQTGLEPLYMGVNRSFYNYALDMRYREVRWIKLDKPFTQRLQRLQEPLVAKHVQRVYIRAWFIEYLLQRDALIKTNKAKTLMKRSFTSILSKFQAEPEKELVLGGGKGRPISGFSSKEIIDSLITAVKGMTNVIELNFEWRDLPLNKDTRVFLTSTRTSFDKSLRKLVLRAQIPKFKELLAITNFDNIDELEFHFDYRTGGMKGIKEKPVKLHFDAESDSEDLPTRPTQDPDSQDLLNTIIPFINHRQTSLRSLFISSSSSADLAYFYEALPAVSLSSLREFGSRISFNQRSLSDPSGILRILKARAVSLRRVSLSAIWPEQFIIPMDRASIYKQKRDEWTPINDRLLSHSSYLSGLEALELPFLSVVKTIPLLRRSSDTLTRLCLTDHYLSKDEVAEVLGVFSHRPYDLQHLHLEVGLLDLPLLLLLATRSPGLFSLVLIFNSVSYFLEPEVEPRHAAIHDWGLSELEVYERRYQPQSPEARFMSSVADSIEAQVMHRIRMLVPKINVLKGHPIR